MRAVLGVDPGVRGGMALLRADGTIASVWVFKPSMVEEELVGAVRDAVTLLRAYDSLECIFEKVGYMPSDGGQGSFTFGAINGLLRGSLLALGIRPRYVYPQAWQAAMECLSGGSKNVTKLRAKQLFPAERVTHASADALLIAEHGRRQFLRAAQRDSAAENRRQ